MTLFAVRPPGPAIERSGGGSCVRGAPRHGRWSTVHPRSVIREDPQLLEGRGHPRGDGASRLLAGERRRPLRPGRGDPSARRAAAAARRPAREGAAALQREAAGGRGPQGADGRVAAQAEGDQGAARGSAHRPGPELGPAQGQGAAVPRRGGVGRVVGEGLGRAEAEAGWTAAHRQRRAIGAGDGRRAEGAALPGVSPPDLAGESLSALLAAEEDGRASPDLGADAEVEEGAAVGARERARQGRAARRGARVSRRAIDRQQRAAARRRRRAGEPRPQGLLPDGVAAAGQGRLQIAGVQRGGGDGAGAGVHRAGDRRGRARRDHVLRGPRAAAPAAGVAGEPGDHQCAVSAAGPAARWIGREPGLCLYPLRGRPQLLGAQAGARLGEGRQAAARGG